MMIFSNDVSDDDDCHGDADDVNDGDDFQWWQ